MKASDAFDQTVHPNLQRHKKTEARCYGAPSHCTITL